MFSKTKIIVIKSLNKSLFLLSTLTNLNNNIQKNPFALKRNNIIHRSNKYTSGHCNIKENEETDQAARSARNNPNSKVLSLISSVGIHRNVDSMQLWDSVWYQVTVNKLKENKHTVELWPKLNNLSGKE